MPVWSTSTFNDTVLLLFKDELLINAACLFACLNCVLNLSECLCGCVENSENICGNVIVYFTAGTLPVWSFHLFSLLLLHSFSLSCFLHLPASRVRGLLCFSILFKHQVPDSHSWFQISVTALQWQEKPIWEPPILYHWNDFRVINNPDWQETAVDHPFWNLSPPLLHLTLFTGTH